MCSCALAGGGDCGLRALRRLWLCGLPQIGLSPNAQVNRCHVPYISLRTTHGETPHRPPPPLYTRVHNWLSGECAHASDNPRRKMGTHKRGQHAFAAQAPPRNRPLATRCDAPASVPHICARSLVACLCRVARANLAWVHTQGLQARRQADPPRAPAKHDGSARGLSGRDRDRCCTIPRQGLRVESGRRRAARRRWIAHRAVQARAARTGRAV